MPLHGIAKCSSNKNGLTYNHAIKLEITLGVYISTKLTITIKTIHTHTEDILKGMKNVVKHREMDVNH